MKIKKTNKTRPDLIERNKSQKMRDAVSKSHANRIDVYKKISNSMVGNDNGKYRVNTAVPDERRKKISASLIGRFRGENHPNWKGGKGGRPNDNEYKAWRLSVFERDNFTCQMPGCGVRGGTLNAHHIIRFVDNEELQKDINNGITLCVRCHNLTKHKEAKFEAMFTEILKVKYGSR